jgi:hypothetical protein
LLNLHVIGKIILSASERNIVKFIEMTPDNVLKWVFVITVMNFQVPYQQGLS